jgi:hypothetical protein
VRGYCGSPPFDPYCGAGSGSAARPSIALTRARRSVALATSLAPASLGSRRRTKISGTLQVPPEAFAGRGRRRTLLGRFMARPRVERQPSSCLHRAFSSSLVVMPQNSFWASSSHDPQPHQSPPHEQRSSPRWRASVYSDGEAVLTQHQSHG